MTLEVVIEPALPSDVTAMQRVEVEAGRRFAEVGLASIAADPPPPEDELRAHVAASTAWVARDIGGDVVGYAVASVVDGEGHLEQVSVRPELGGAGIGAALIEEVCRWAAGEGFDAVSLTTFRDVAWNGPYYERRGFRALADDELGPGLRAIRADEASRGLDVAPRLAMRRVL